MYNRDRSLAGDYKGVGAIHQQNSKISLALYNIARRAYVRLCAALRSRDYGDPPAAQLGARVKGRDHSDKSGCIRKLAMSTDERSVPSSYRGYEEEARELVKMIIQRSIEIVIAAKIEAPPIVDVAWPTGGEFTVEKGEAAINKLVEVCMS